MSNNLASIVLAAGKGTRMKSDLPKVLHRVGERTLVEHCVSTLEDLGVERIIAIVGYKQKMVREVLGERVEYAVQAEQLGTGHAVLQARGLLANHDGYVTVSNGDNPFLTEKMFTDVCQACKEGEASAALLTVENDNLADWGRVVRDEKGGVAAIVEAKDADPDTLAVREKSTGLFCFKASDLFLALEKIDANNEQKEYYLPDVVKVLNQEEKKVVSVVTEDYKNIIGINSQEDLQRAEQNYSQ